MHPPAVSAPLTPTNEGEEPMKVKLTVTITLETELYPEDYASDGITTEEAIIAYETQKMMEEPYDSELLEQAFDEGGVASVKIEKVEERAEAA
jgi:hypothetical protein